MSQEKPAEETMSILQMTLSAVEQEKFEIYKEDLRTLLVFMAGCAIRERMALVEEYRLKAALGSKAAAALLVDEENAVKDFCRIVALCEQSTSGEVQRAYEHMTARVLRAK